MIMKPMYLCQSTNARRLRAFVSKKDIGAAQDERELIGFYLVPDNEALVHYC